MKRNPAAGHVTPGSCGWYGIRIRPEQRRVEACPPEPDAARFFLPMKSDRHPGEPRRANAVEGPGTVAEKRETLRLDPSVVVDQLLVEVRQTLESQPPSSQRRTLLGKLERLDRSVARWSALPPHDDQVQAMLDVLHALQDSIPTGL